MFKEILPRKTQKVLAQIGKSPIKDRFYLAGGSAAALHLGHRLSLDLDFFTEKKFESPELELLEDLKKVSDISSLSIAPGTLHCEMNGVRLSFFQYTYPLLYTFHKLENVSIADLREIALMKIVAIADRGSKKDFIDLYFAAKEVMPLPELFSAFQKKYKKINYNLVHIVKALVYFKEADKEKLPKMIKPISWLKIKKYFEAEVKKLNIL